MTDLIDRIGPVVGVVAFLGLAILAFLIFQQAREIRRLREWAGRAPERATEAADAVAAVAEARGEEPQAAPADTAPEPAPSDGGRIALWWEGVRERFAPAWEELDRRSPFDPRYFLVVIAAAAVAAGVLTSGFGLIGGDDNGGNGGGKNGKGGGQEQPEKVEVSVLNATQEEGIDGSIIQGVPGLADEIARDVVKPAGFKVGEKADAAEGLETSTIFFEQDGEDDANALAEAVADQLGETEVRPMIDEIADRAGGASVVLVVGQDDAPEPG
jgi:hypothetical protein